MTSLLIVLAMPDEVVARYYEPLKARFPGVEVNAVNHRDKIDPYIGRTEILLTFGAMMTDEVYRKAPRLEWVQVLGTGVDKVVDAPTLARHVIVTNMHGIHGPSCAEAALASMLALSRQLKRSLRAQDRKAWDRFPVRILDGKTVTIFGIGVIATALAPLCKAFNMRVIGVTSAPRELPGFDRVVGRDKLTEAVRDCDHLVLLTPHTLATNQIVNDAVLAAMKPGSFLVNLARGGIVDEPALIRALEEGGIAGAALDVFSVEPLPVDNKLWSLPNVIMTPHLGGFYEEYPDQVLPVVEENLRRFLAGDREHMINRINREGVEVRSP
jgi:D-2-hydroxyacid dehydrogenase (NADP+)